MAHKSYSSWKITKCKILRFAKNTLYCPKTQRFSGIDQNLRAFHALWKKPSAYCAFVKIPALLSPFQKLCALSQIYALSRKPLCPLHFSPGLRAFSKSCAFTFTTAHDDNTGRIKHAFLGQCHWHFHMQKICAFCSLFFLHPFCSANFVAFSSRKLFPLILNQSTA